MSKIKVLIIEDSPPYRLLLKAFLEDMNTSFVGEAETLAEAGKLLTEDLYDFVFLDLLLPDSPDSTLDTFLLIQSKAPTTSIIIISGADIDGQELIKRGACDFLAKETITQDKLRCVIDLALCRKKIKEI